MKEKNKVLWEDIKMTNFYWMASEGFSEKMTAELRRSKGWESSGHLKRVSVSSPGGATSTYWLDMKCNPSKVVWVKHLPLGVGLGYFYTGLLLALFLHLCKWDNDTYFSGRKLCCPREISVVMTIFPSLVFQINSVPYLKPSEQISRGKYTVREVCLEVRESGHRWVLLPSNT